MAECIDLRVICKNKRWKWKYEEAYKAEHMRQNNIDAPFFVEILCVNGTIYPLDTYNILVCVEDKPKMMKKMSDIGGTQYQGNSVWKFPVEKLDDIAKILKPRLKRKGMSAEHMARIRKSLVQGA